MIDKTTQRAYAKINIGLDVLRRRADGYHEVKMIMQTVDIYDELVLERRKEPGIELRMDNSELPSGGDNLICRAADLLFREKKITGGVNISLTKRIPIAAGMAGGSADAAAALRGLNELFDMGYSLKELQALGVGLGADIPYCLAGGTMLSEGIGEILTPLPAPPEICGPNQKWFTVIFSVVMDTTVGLMALATSTAGAPPLSSPDMATF